MKKLSNTEDELNKCVAYKKKRSSWFNLRFESNVNRTFHKNTQLKKTL